jgi:hypothetical protein
MQFRAGILFLLLATTAGHTQEVRRYHHAANVSANREGRVTYYAAPDEVCGTGIAPTITILEYPSYGRVSLRPDRLFARGGSIPPRSESCRGKFVDALAVMYKPAPGFYGSDRVVLQVYLPPATNGPATTLIDEIFISVR